MAESLVVDVVIIGGGPAGLSAALVLGRARRSVVVVDAEQPRNRVTHESHGYLTRDGVAPGEFRAIAKEQMAPYPVQFLRDTATAVAGEDGAFRTQTEQGTTITSRKVLFATGMKDVPPEIDGLAQVYGRSAFVCPYCDGWELRDQQLVVIAPTGYMADHLVKVLRGWSKNLALCTNGPAELPEPVRTDLTEHGVPLYEEAIERIESEAGQVRAVWLKDGTQLPCTGIFFVPILVQATRLPEQLGCELSASGAAIVGPSGDTSVAGVYVVGDAAAGRYPQLITAAADGAGAAFAINTGFLDEEWHKQRSRAGGRLTPQIGPAS